MGNRSLKKNVLLEVGANIERVRAARRAHVSQVLVEAGYKPSRHIFYFWKKGACLPDIYQLYKVAQALRCRAYDFLPGAKPQPFKALWNGEAPRQGRMIQRKGRVKYAYSDSYLSLAGVIGKKVAFFVMRDYSSMRKAAEGLGINYNYLQLILRGRRVPSLAMLLSFAADFDVDVRDLVPPELPRVRGAA